MHSSAALTSILAAVNGLVAGTCASVAGGLDDSAAGTSGGGLDGSRIASFLHWFRTVCSEVKNVLYSALQSEGFVVLT